MMFHLRLMFHVILPFLLCSCGGWKIVRGDYDSKTFVPRALFLTDNDGLYCGARQGLFKYQNKKIKKVMIPVPEDMVLRAIIKHGNSLFAGFEGSGLFRSDDQGKTWVEKGVNQMANKRIWGLLLCENKIIAVAWPRFIYESDNNGETWKDISAGMPPPGSPGVAMGHSNGMVAKDTFLFCSVHKEGIFRKGFGQNQWEPVRAGLPENFLIRSLCVAGPSLFSATEDGVYRSDDNGINWVASNSGIQNTMIISLFEYKSSLYATNNHGQVYKSIDGKNWEPLKEHLSNDHVIYDLIRIKDILFISADGQQKQPSGIYSLKLKKQ
jgi:photosystem II stability/assembly factor-like uncharacterized protein